MMVNGYDMWRRVDCYVITDLSEELVPSIKVVKLSGFESRYVI
jgi:hypothetical protein